MKDLNIPTEYIDSYFKNSIGHKPGIRNEQVIEHYNNWATDYDQDLNINVYRGPQIAADMVNIFLKDKNSSILDIGAGTGHVGFYLKRHGFNHIDALEPSESMLNIAKDKKVYENLFMESIKSNECTSLKENSYDMCVQSGAFGEGHIPAQGLREFARLAKPNGYIILVMRKEYLANVEDYSSNFKPLIESLIREQVFSNIACFEVENYSFNKTGLVYVFKKL